MPGGEFLSPDTTPTPRKERAQGLPLTEWGAPSVERRRVGSTQGVRKAKIGAMVETALGEMAHISKAVVIRVLEKDTSIAQREE